jgi:hypothetical protein
MTLFACSRSHLNFLIYEENFIFFFISVCLTGSYQAEAESKEKHVVRDPMPELTITTPYVHSRVADTNTLTMGNSMPDSTLTLCQSPQSETLDLASGEQLVR